MTDKPTREGLMAIKNIEKRIGTITPLEKVLICLFEAAHEFDKKDTKEGRLVASLMCYSTCLDYTDTVYRLFVPTGEIRANGAVATIFEGTIDEYYEKTKEQWERIVEKW